MGREWRLRDFNTILYNFYKNKCRYQSDSTNEFDNKIEFVYIRN